MAGALRLGAMSDISAGPGWWVASDGKWYPPEQHADPAYRQRYAPAPEPAATVPDQPAVARAGQPMPDAPPTTDVLDIPDTPAVPQYPVTPPVVPGAVPPTTWGAPAAQAVTDTDRGSNRFAAGIAFAMGLLLIVGSFAPWLSFGGSFDGSQNGWNRTDGIVTIVCGVVACGVAGVLWAGVRNLVCKLILLLSGVVAFAVFLIEWLDIVDEIDTAEEAFTGLDVTLAWGFWAVGAAALILVITAFLERSRWSIEQ